MEAVSLAWAPRRGAIAAGEADGSVTVLEWQTGTIVFNVKEHIEAVEQIAWSQDQLLIASGSNDGMIRLWDSRQGELLCKFSGWAPNLSFSQDDQSLGPVTSEKKHALSLLKVQRSPVCDRTAGHAAETIVAKNATATVQ